MKRNWIGGRDDDDREDVVEEREGAATMTRHDEELLVGTREVTTGSVTARKHVETSRYEDVVPREVEYGEAEHVGPLDGDSGEILTLEDGSISIPLFEEQIVVQKQLVVRERVVIRKRVTTEEHRIEATLKSEQIQVEGDVDDRTA